MSEEERQALVFIPALGPLLLRAEEMKGGPLTEEEVSSVRDNAICATVTPEQLAGLEESRGYRDIDPEDCWAEWQRLRGELGGESSAPQRGAYSEDEPASDLGAGRPSYGERP